MSIVVAKAVLVLKALGEPHREVLWDCIMLAGRDIYLSIGYKPSD